MSSAGTACGDVTASHADRKSTRLNSSHSQISYAVFCLKKKKLLHVRAAIVLTPVLSTTFAGVSAIRLRLQANVARDIARNFRSLRDFPYLNLPHTHCIL